MITERKLRSLKPATRIRKIGRLLYEFECVLRTSPLQNKKYVSMLLALAGEDLNIPPQPTPPSDDEWMRVINQVRHAILTHVGDDPADWDLLPKWRDDTGNVESVSSSGMRVYLEDIRSPFNVGAIFRTSAAFAVDEIILSPDCASPEHPRAIRTAMGSTSIVPWRVAALSAMLSEDCDRLFALETGGRDVSEFSFPRQGIVVVGNEELGISPETRLAAGAACGVCFIVLPGAKSSLNVSVAFGILAHRWHEQITGR